MQKFFRKLEIDDTVKELFLAFLFNEKYQVPFLSTEQEQLISDISRQFLMSGFILESCNFNASQNYLVKQLKYQRRIQVLKQMSLKNQVNNIACRLNDKRIVHVFLKGVALNLDDIYPSGIRFSRDIDLLVRPEFLDQTYQMLKTLGFRYLDPKVQDSTQYHFDGHHLPEMINDDNIVLELHWRLTSPYKFKNCPLAEKMLDSRRSAGLNSNICCPKVEIIIPHLIYHSFEQHRLSLGPVILFDLATIFVLFDKKWPIDSDLLQKLEIEKQFELCEEFIERVVKESRLSAESKLLFDQIFKDSQWLRLSEESETVDSMADITRVEIFDKLNSISTLISIARRYRTLYQVSYYSPKFWIFLFSGILVSLKKVMRGLRK